MEEDMEFLESVREHLEKWDRLEAAHEAKEDMKEFQAHVCKHVPDSTAMHLREVAKRMGWDRVARVLLDFPEE